MSTEASNFFPHPFKDTDELLRVLADNDGEIADVGLSEDLIVLQAADLGLVTVRDGDGWTMRDTVCLTGTSRLKLGLPPIIVRPPVAATILHAAMAAIGRLFGTREPRT
jgi:hypothetical protein